MAKEPETQKTKKLLGTRDDQNSKALHKSFPGCARCPRAVGIVFQRKLEAPPKMQCDNPFLGIVMVSAEDAAKCRHKP